jgi:hypothetical protein
MLPPRGRRQHLSESRAWPACNSTKHVMTDAGNLVPTCGANMWCRHDVVTNLNSCMCLAAVCRLLLENDCSWAMAHGHQGSCMDAAQHWPTAALLIPHLWKPSITELIDRPVYLGCQTHDAITCCMVECICNRQL